MTKIAQSKYKRSRRVLESIHGRPKDAVYKKKYGPGQHASAAVKHSDYGKHLIEKQKIKFHYGRITEKQFKNYFKKAKQQKGNTAQNMAHILESRLDMAVYRAGYAPTIFAARQLVSHKHILVNDKVINIASYLLKVGDTVSIKSSSRNMSIVEDAIKNRTNVDYYKLENSDNITDKTKRLDTTYIKCPDIQEIPYPFTPEFNQVVELYSK